MLLRLTYWNWYSFVLETLGVCVEMKNYIWNTQVSY